MYSKCCRLLLEKDDQVNTDREMTKTLICVFQRSQTNKEFKFVFPSVVKISSIYKDRKYWCLPLVISSTSIFRSRLKISMLPAIVCSFCKVEIIQVLKLYILCLLCNWLTLQPIFSINPNKNFFYVSNQSLKNCCPSHILKGLALNIVH